MTSPQDSWKLLYHGFSPEQERLRETLTTVGNGYLGTRGCFAFKKAEGDTHYPGTYIAGVYNKLPTVVHGKTIYNNDFVNCPNWLSLEIKIGDADFIDPLQAKILDYTHQLDMRRAVVSRQITFQDEQGRITKIETQRFAGMHNPHQLGLQCKITAQNYSQPITIKSTLDGSVINSGVARYRNLSCKHLQFIEAGENGDGIYLHTQTNVSRMKIFFTAKHELYENDEPSGIKPLVTQDDETISATFSFPVREGATYVLDKLVSVYTSNDQDTENGDANSTAAVKSFADLCDLHIRTWEKLWEQADLVIDGDPFSQLVVRLHIYHLLSTASLHNSRIDAGMPARGLSGEPYRGHIFWDELYIFPLYNLRFPEITKALLTYRYRRLDDAREYARENEYTGAMYPWQTADDGKEETQIIHYNPVSEKWDPDLSRRQRHVSIAVAYNVWQYYQADDDRKFLQDYGAEMILEIARFWASIARYDETDGRYHIAGVMGPDEFHEKYADSQEGGITDNAYTNIMVCWVLDKACRMLESFPELLAKTMRKIDFRREEVDRWRNIMRKLHVELTEEGIISQFKGYMDLEELDWDGYRKEYGDIHRLDRILKAEGIGPDHFKVAKQADTLMIYYLLTPWEVQEILQRLGYTIKDPLQLMQKNYQYYSKRTSHGSTLSHVVHAAIQKYSAQDDSTAWEWFQNALKSDIYDTQGGTTAEAIHCGVMAGTIDIVLKNFAGLQICRDYIEIDPDLPQHWNKIAFRVIHRHNRIELLITQNTVRVTYLEGNDEKITIRIDEGDYKVARQGTLDIPYRKETEVA